MQGFFSCVGGVVVSVLATGSKSHGFNPGQGDGFLKAKNQQHTFVQTESKAGGPLHKI
jgi:hypothetical protein